MNYLLAVAASLTSLLTYSQTFPPKNYPRDYFHAPLNIPISLAANFGELRPNHYHMGLDIRTEKKENLPVMAAADGYIARVKIEPAGFGQAIYIQHPNGYTTLYAHLNKFFPALAAYVEQQQYKLRSWQVFIEIPPALFPVKKGDLIAYSGNTGGSQGPHLHFEIRRTADDTNLNPLLFGLPVPDTTPPVFLRLAIYDRSRSVYEQAPKILPVRRSTAAAYSIMPGLIALGSPRVSFAISAFDTQSGSANPNGIYQAVLYDNDQPVEAFQMDQISYEHTRSINGHIDYRTRETGGPFLQHLSELPGTTEPSIYRSLRKDLARPPDHGGLPLTTPFASLADGVIDLSDGAVHTIRIEGKDAYGNISELTYQVQYQQLLDVPDLPPMPGKKFYPGMLDGQETESCAFYIAEKGLYDSVHIDHTAILSSLKGAISAAHNIGYSWIPLQEPLLVRLKPDQAPDPAVMGKVVMVRTAGDKKEVQRPEWKDGWASARYREFGSFQLVEDDEAPQILLLGSKNGVLSGKAARIAFAVKDNLGAIRSFRAELDGRWLCFTNDKGLAFIYKFDVHCPPGKHVLKVTAEDEAGNQATKEYSFTR